MDSNNSTQDDRQPKSALAEMIDEELPAAIFRLIVQKARFLLRRVPLQPFDEFLNGRWVADGAA